MATEPDLFNVHRRKPRVKTPSKYPGELKRLMMFYRGFYKGKFGRYPLTGPQEWSKLKRLIEEYGPALVERKLRAFFDSREPFVLRAGYSIGVFRSQWMALDVQLQQQSGEVASCRHEPKCQTAAEHTRKYLDSLRQTAVSPSHTTSKPSEAF